MNEHAAVQEPLARIFVEVDCSCCFVKPNATRIKHPTILRLESEAYNKCIMASPSCRKASSLLSLQFTKQYQSSVTANSTRREFFLDFLHPPQHRFISHARPSRISTSKQGDHSLSPQMTQTKRRAFSSFSSQKTSVLANPRNDVDGKEMMVEITSRASTRLKEIMDRDKNPSLVLRVTVESGGCHGFQYLMSLSDKSKILEEEDTVFEASDGTGAQLVMDEPSLELLNGSKVDFTRELIGSQFKIVDNPHATSSCGCGTSFDIKA
jgi:iron-sulfur cluster assembly accessory protein